jgi:hypothetical protein
MCGVLLQNAKARQNELAQLLEEVDREWVAEDGFYQFYHQSFKVYHIQAATEKIVKALSDLNPRPEVALNDWFMEIVAQGTGRDFEISVNQNWTAITGPMLGAFFHARYFLQLVVKYANELETSPQVLPSGWAAVLYLYSLR